MGRSLLTIIVKKCPECEQPIGYPVHAKHTDECPRKVYPLTTVEKLTRAGKTLAEFGPPIGMDDDLQCCMGFSTHSDTCEWAMAAAFFGVKP